MFNLSWKLLIIVILGVYIIDIDIAVDVIWLGAVLTVGTGVNIVVVISIIVIITIIVESGIGLVIKDEIV